MPKFPEVFKKMLPTRQKSCSSKSDHHGSSKHSTSSTQSHDGDKRGHGTPLKSLGSEPEIQSPTSPTSSDPHLRHLSSTSFPRSDSQGDDVFGASGGGGAWPLIQDGGRNMPARYPPNHHETSQNYDRQNRTEPINLSRPAYDKVSTNTDFELASRDHGGPMSVRDADSDARDIDRLSNLLRSHSQHHSMGGNSHDQTLHHSGVPSLCDSDYGSATITPTSSMDLPTSLLASEMAASSMTSGLRQMSLAGEENTARFVPSLSVGSASFNNSGVQTVIERKPKSDEHSFAASASGRREASGISSSSTRSELIQSRQAQPPVQRAATTALTPISVPDRGRQKSDSSNSSHTLSPISPLSPSAMMRPFYPVDSSAGPIGEMFPDAALNTPMGALRKSRKRLCLHLNIEQVKMVGDYFPDYRGLADMLGFEAIEVSNFWDQDPSYTLFMEWIMCKDGHLKPAKLRVFVDCLQKLERQDILEDCAGLIVEDVSDFFAEEKLLRRYAVNQQSKFDCYVNIADEDILTIGNEILNTLEGVYSLRLCLTLRDVTLGPSQFDAMAEMLETRCNSKVLIVLSKNFENSDACQFLTQYAVTLDPGSRRNKLIPLLVDEDVVVPRVLRCLAMLNYYRDNRLGFLWPKLKHAISLK